MEPTKFYGSVPKGLRRLAERHPNQIDEIGNEGDGGYWVYLRKGWWNSHYAVHSVHEMTVAEAVAVFNESVERCPEDCECGNG